MCLTFPNRWQGHPEGRGPAGRYRGRMKGPKVVPEANRVNIKKSNLVGNFIFIPSKLMILKSPEIEK